MCYCTYLLHVTHAWNVCPFAAIMCLLSEAEELSKTELPLHFDKISSECQNLQKFVSDSVLFITGYDKKIAQKVSNTEVLA